MIIRRGRKISISGSWPKIFSAEQNVLPYGIFFSKKSSMRKKIIKKVFRGTNIFSARKCHLIAKRTCKLPFGDFLSAEKKFFPYLEVRKFFLKKIFRTERKLSKVFSAEQKFLPPGKKFAPIRNNFPCSPGTKTKAKPRKYHGRWHFRLSE